MVRSLGSALSAIHLISCLSTSNALTIERRSGVIPTTLPGSWVSEGCYVDVGRTLTGGGYDDNTLMTDESCINYCSSAGFIYAGTEYSSQCYCGNSLAAGGVPAPEGESGCSMTCTGNATEACGGPNRLNLFWSGTTGPQTNPGNANWTFSGCYTEGTTGRTLPNGVTTTGGSSEMTVDLCLAGCQAAGYLLAGAEYSGECWCGNTIQNGATLAPEGLSGCSMLCNGNHSEFCGGSSRLDVYDFKNEVSLPPYTTISSTTSTSASASKSSTSSVVTTSSTVGSSSSTKSSTSSVVATSSTVGSSTSSTKSSTSSVVTSSSTVRPSTSSTKSSTSTSVSSSKSTSTTVSTTASSSKSSTSSSISSLKSTSTTVSTTASSSKSSTSSVSSSKSTSTTVSTTASSSKSSTSSTSVKSSTSSTSNTSKSTSKSVVPTTSSTSSTKPLTSSTSSSATLADPVTSTTSSAASVSPTLGIKQTIGSYSFLGCYTEATNERALTGASFFDYPAMTLEECQADCAGYTYFGVEYGGECYCGNAINPGSVLATLTDCSFICPGNQYEYCGAGNRLEMYQLGAVSSASGTSTSTSATGTTTKPTTSATISTGTSTKPTSTLATSTTSKTSTSTSSGASTTSTGWVYQGCYVDGLNGRDMEAYQAPDNQALTVESCLALCASNGYTLAGMEYAVQCFCDNFLYNGAALATNQGDCSTECSGNANEICGAGNRLSLYSSAGAPQIYQPPAVQTTGLPANWVYKGCLQDNIPSNEDANEILSTFPYMVWNNASNDAVACITQCQAFGFNAAGLEYGSECFCGDVENIYVASAPGVSTDPDATQFYTRSAQPQIVADSECNSACSGAPQYLCGSGNLLSYYAWDGPEPLYDFGFPTGTDAGEYTFLIGGVVVPLMTSQVVTGKVTFTEKYGSGEPNGTGAYELDLTEIDNWDLAWRTMTGLETDVFCSAGLTLPDKAGRQVTVGGWAGQSNFGIRLYWPDGSAGVPGTNEWQEDAGVLSLQVPRWYPSAMVMANGSIMIIGGEIGSNDAEQPTLELLPATGVPEAGTTSGYSNTTVYLDFLQRTAPFNLYPFVCVVPSGIFVAYFNEARILDEVTFETIKTLPNMPAAVNDPTGGRTYQLEGSMVLLPQYAPYTDNLGVLICGGSTSNGGYPIDNCISTYPEDDEPVWTIERMPSRRVMPCMAGLPDGTYVILNGAQHGVAGFGLGGDPNYNAVLYDPTKPVNGRMSIMANTTVARLYHSEAIVLIDGRVIISGSDPTGDYTAPAGEWPEEYRVEVFSPPYLLSGLARPTFSLSSTDWAYGDEVTITFDLPSGDLSAIKASMLGSVVSTHGNAMGQRTIFPALSNCAGNTCTVTAPPNAHVAPPGWFMFFVLDGPTPAVGQFIRIGKDPGNIGNWPAGLAAFEPLPGV